AAASAMEATWVMPVSGGKWRDFQARPPRRRGMFWRAGRGAGRGGAGARFAGGGAVVGGGWAGGGGWELEGEGGGGGGRVGRGVPAQRAAMERPARYCERRRGRAISAGPSLGAAASAASGAGVDWGREARSARPRAWGSRMGRPALRM